MMRHFRNRHQKISPVRQVQQLQPRYEVSRGYRSHMAVDLLTSNRCLLFYRKGHEIRLIGSTHQLLHERVQLYSNPECYFPEIGGKPVPAVRQEPEPNRKPVQGNVNALAKVPQTSLHEREQNSTEGDHASGVSGRARSMCLSHTRFPSIPAFARQHPFLWLAPLHPHGKGPQVSAIHSPVVQAITCIARSVANYRFAHDVDASFQHESCLPARRYFFYCTLHSPVLIRCGCRQVQVPRCVDHPLS
jgi:hypothetical protein